MKPAENHDEGTFSIHKLEPKMIIEEKIAPRPTTFRGDMKDDFSEEEDLEVPAFIRRKMKKN